LARLTIVNPAKLVVGIIQITEESMDIKTYQPNGDTVHNFQLLTAISTIWQKMPDSLLAQLRQSTEPFTAVRSDTIIVINSGEAEEIGEKGLMEIAKQLNVTVQRSPRVGTKEYWIVLPTTS
jgi:hypothetical protein